MIPAAHDIAWIRDADVAAPVVADFLGEGRQLVYAAGGRGYTRAAVDDEAEVSAALLLREPPIGFGWGRDTTELVPVGGA